MRSGGAAARRLLLASPRTSTAYGAGARPRARARLSPYISPHLPISPHISPHLTSQERGLALVLDFRGFSLAHLYAVRCSPCSFSRLLLLTCSFSLAHLFPRGADPPTPSKGRPETEDLRPNPFTGTPCAGRTSPHISPYLPRYAVRWEDIRRGVAMLQVRARARGRATGRGRGRATVRATGRCRGGGRGRGRGHRPR